MASPARRLPVNAPGPFFVDDSCIDCGACRWIAPSSFGAHGAHAYVAQQPGTEGERRAAFQALGSCPTGSIGSADKQGLKDVLAAFPREMGVDDVRHCGFHSEDSFGAASYLILRPGGNVLVDSPRWHKPLVRAIERLGGVTTMFLTHRDDVAEHARFRAHFGCERVIHEDDLRPSTRDVERVLSGVEPVSLDDDLTVWPTPGHTQGSACLLFAERVLFTGDHLAFSRNLGHLYAFAGACWYDWEVQKASMRRLADATFHVVLPGHGAPWLGRPSEAASQMQRCIRWMEAAR